MSTQTLTAIVDTDATLVLSCYCTDTSVVTVPATVTADATTRTAVVPVTDVLGGSGAANITVTDSLGRTSAASRVTRTLVTLASVLVSPDGAAVPQGSTQQYTVAGTGTDGQPYTPPPGGVWSRTPTTAGTISSAGLFAAASSAAAGAFSVTYTAPSGPSDSAPGTITSVAADVTLDSTSATVAQGDSHLIVATVHDGAGATMAGESATFAITSGGTNATLSGATLTINSTATVGATVAVRARVASNTAIFADLTATVSAAAGASPTTAQMLDGTSGAAFKARGVSGVLATWRADEFADTTAFLNAIPRSTGDTTSPGVSLSKDIYNVTWTPKGSDYAWYDAYHAGTVSPGIMPLFTIATDHPRYTAAKYLKLKVPASGDPLAASDYKPGQITLKYASGAQQVRTRMVLGFLNPFTTQGASSAAGTGAQKLHATGWASGNGGNRVEFSQVNQFVHIANAGTPGGVMDDSTNLTHNVMADGVTDTTYTGATKGGNAPFTDNRLYVLEIDELTASDKRSCHLKSRWAPLSDTGVLGPWTYLHDKTCGVTNATDLTAQVYADFIMNFNYPPSAAQYIALLGMQALDLVTLPAGF